MNAKLLQSQNIQNKSLNIIAIGSSITQDNLNSDVIVQHFGNSFYNFSSWGTDISETRYFCEYYVSKYHPKLVLILSYHKDFTKNNIIKLPYLPFVYYPIIKWYYAAYKTVIELNSAINDNKAYKIYRNNREYITSLMFDAYGGVSLTIPKENIEPRRWNDSLDFSKTELDENQYKELDILAKNLHKQNIILVFVQVPYREDEIKGLDLTSLYKHTDKCRSILSENGQVYLNYATDTELSNIGYFVDVWHQNETGAVQLTKRIAHDIDSLGILKK